MGHPCFSRQTEKAGHYIFNTRVCKLLQGIGKVIRRKALSSKTFDGVVVSFFLR